MFRLDATGSMTLLHKFAGGTDGAAPHTSLVRDAAGNLYGTTRIGGDSSCTHGCGTVFKLDANGVETVLYSFAGNLKDGAYPRGGPLVQDAVGNLYGTTYYGGTGTCTDGFGFGCGTVFKVDANGTETVLHSFTGGDGQWPYGGLIMDAAGNLYGTALQGGPSNNGVVFKLAP